MFSEENLWGVRLKRYYSVAGLVANVAIWSVLLFYLDKGIGRINPTKKWNGLYKAVIAFFIVFTTLHVVFDVALLGHGFEENSNDWYWNIDQEAHKWGGTYEGKITTLKK